MYYSIIIENILSTHGYNPKLWVDIDLTFDEEYPKIKDELSNIYWKYEKIEEQNEMLKKYKNVNEDYLTQEERNTINRIKKEIELKKNIEEHNALIEKIQRIEMNIDKLVQKEVEKKCEYKDISITSIFASLLSITYSVIATIMLFNYLYGGEILKECFEEGGLIGIGFGTIVIVITILFLVSAYLGCINLMNMWSEKIGLFALVAGALGVAYGPLMLFQAFSRSHMEIELGYKDSSKSYTQLYNEYERLQATRKINGKR